MVCSALRGASEPSPAIANITAGTLQHLQQIRRPAFRHRRRVGNKAAHVLVKYGQCINDFGFVWIQFRQKHYFDFLPVIVKWVFIF